MKICTDATLFGAMAPVQGGERVQLIAPSCNPANNGYWFRETYPAGFAEEVTLVLSGLFPLLLLVGIIDSAEVHL